MSALALSIVLAPVLIRGPDVLEDMELCLQPGKTLPKAMYDAAGRKQEHTAGKGTLVGLLETWINGWMEVSGKDGKGTRCTCDWAS